MDSRILSAVLALAIPIGLGISAPTSPPLNAGIELSGWQSDLVPQAPGTEPDAATIPAGVVRIDTALTFQNAQGVGTGVVLTPDGQVLTNNHVVEGATTITATDLASGRTFGADVLGYDRANDIALVQLRGAGVATAPIGDSSSVSIGEPVVGIGNAGGAGPSRETGTVTALDRTVVADDRLTGSSEQLSGLIEITAPLRPGDSGGPLLNSAGRVIGINAVGTETFEMRSTGGFAIPINRALGIADQIRAGNGSSGVHVGPSALLGVGVAGGGDGGAQVLQVVPGSPADQAGIVSGATITRIGDIATPDATALSRALDARRPGDTVAVSYDVPGGQSTTAQLTLAAGPPG